MIGVLHDREFEQFEANLNWLETTGVLVEQFDPSKAPQEVAKRPAVRQILALDVRARLRVPAGAKEDQARRLLVKAEETCLVTNSLKVQPHLESIVEVEDA